MKHSAKLFRTSLAVGCAVGGVLALPRGALAAGTPSVISAGSGFATVPVGDPFSAGGLTLGAQFQPSANTQSVSMWVCATPLFKGGTPVLGGGGTNPNRIGLAAQEQSPANISGAGLTPGAKAMPLTNPGTFAYDAYTWPTTCSAPGTFYSGSPSFSSAVRVTAVWSTAETLLPSGSYSGYIQLYVATIP